MIGCFYLSVPCGVYFNRFQPCPLLSSSHTFIKPSKSQAIPHQYLPLPKGQALGYSAKSTLLVPREKVAVLLARQSARQRLSVSTSIPHRWSIVQGPGLLLLLYTYTMPYKKAPIPAPVVFTFENGIELTTSIDPQSRKHSVVCDLCGTVIVLGITASGGNLHKHRAHEPCTRTAFKNAKKQADERIKVCKSQL